MPTKQNIIIDSDDSVSDELRHIGLSKEIIIQVAHAAAFARAESLPVDPATTSGMFSYIYGIRAIRLALLPSGWKMSRVGNVESTINHELGIQLFFQNVDTACDIQSIPHSISKKGSFSRQLINESQDDLFSHPQTQVEKPTNELGKVPTVWVVCVACNGTSIRAEVSRPTAFEGNQFEGFHQRIFCLDESIEPSVTPLLNQNDNFDNLNVSISKK